MSILEKMSIQGIRSFGAESAQRIEFFTPVTLILGANGTGKTTIIECLKYATTGELPPGAKTGSSFVHDPRLAHALEVKAKVALQIKDVRGCSMIVSRSLVATQRDKSKQGTLKTLDGSIKRQLPNGDVVSLSSRSGEIDLEMTTSLGVSKAVFENVIFCHQEESSWPLLEAKSVKQRFDDLFASSRYVKALDAIRKTRLEQDGNAKICKAELKHLSRSREEANQVRTQKTDTECNLGSQEKRLSEINEKLEPVTTELMIYRKKYAELVEYQSEARSCESEKTQLDTMMRNLLENIRNEFSGSDEALKEAVEQAGMQLATKERSLSDIENEIRRANRISEANSVKRSRLLVKKTQLEVEIQRLDTSVKVRDNLMTQLSSTLGLPGFTETITEADVLELSSMLKKKLLKSESDFQDRKASTEKEVKSFQTRIYEARANLVRVEQSIDATEKSLKENKHESATVREKLSRAETASLQLDDIRKQLAIASAFRKDLELSLESSTIQKQISEFQSNRSLLEEKITFLDSKIVELQRKAMENHESDLLKKNLKAKIDSAKKIRSRNLDVLDQLFSGELVPPVNVDCSDDLSRSTNACETLPKKFQKRLDTLAKLSKESQHNLSQLEQERSSLEAALSFQRKQLHDKEDDLRKMEDRLLAACGSVDLERHLDKLLARKKQLESDYANDEGSLYLWKKFSDRLSNDSECPLCHREFDSENDHHDLQAELEQRISSMPRDLDAKRRELDHIVKQYEDLIELKPVSHDFSILQEKVIPDLKSRVDLTDSKLEKIKSDIDEESSKLFSIQSDESLALSLQGDVAVLGKFEYEIADLHRSLRKIASECATEETLSLEDLQSERDSLRVSCTDASTEMELLRSKLDSLLKEKQSAISKENILKDSLHSLEREHQATSNLNFDLERLCSVQLRLSEELKTLHLQLDPCKQDLDKAEEDRRQAVVSRDEQICVAQLEIQEWRDKIRDFEAACTSSRPSEGTSPHLDFEEISKNLRKLDIEIDDLKSNMSSNTDNLKNLQKEIANHKICQRELDDCLRLRDIRGQYSLISNRVQELQRKIDECCHSEGSGTVDLVKQVNNLTVKEENLRKQKQIVVDRVTQLQTELRMLDQSLVEKYADADSDYIKKVYELKTAELAAVDLDRYYHALDRAIMSYHASKMAEVNQIIRDLWRTTYRGNDIDYIEICSEEEPLSAAVSGTSNTGKLRRTYNYRVVMVKAASTSVASTGNPQFGGRTNKSSRLSTEARLDMRGRCSAGQKVLASLVIRLALAEVFCLQCGVLALDEPTTNLDRENIESLAYALNEIIKSRSSQRNFQLIVITHDEDFIELLGRADCVGHLFRVSRNSQGLSEIEKVRIEDQFH